MSIYSRKKSDNILIENKEIIVMQRRTLAMVMAAMVVCTIFTGCGKTEKTVSAASASTKAEKISDVEKTKKDESSVGILTIEVTADQGWVTDSMPAIVHIGSRTAGNVDFYHAVYPDETGSRGTSTVQLTEGEYNIEFICPINNDSSSYEINDTDKIRDITMAAGAKEEHKAAYRMKRISADLLPDEMIREIVDKTRAAIENGDASLKGETGKSILDRLAQSVRNCPNASEATKEEAGAVKEALEANLEQEVRNGGESTEDESGQAQVPQNNAARDTASPNNTAQDTIAPNNNTVQDTAAPNNTTQNTDTPNNTAQNTPVQNNTIQNTEKENNAVQNTTTQNTPSAPDQTIVTEPEQPVHEHTWAEHRVEEQIWETFTVYIDDYETVPKWNCNCGAVIDIEEHDNHAIQHLLAEEPDNGFVSSEKVRYLGTHTEEVGEYVTSSRVDYYYCTECGARK